MIAYFDTSAFVPLLVAEPGSVASREVWDAADAVVTSRLLYVEAHAALARAVRAGRITDRQHRALVRTLVDRWRDFEVVEVDAALAVRAAELAERFALRGYDAVHCASAAELEDADLVVASGDKELLDACAALGLATARTI